MEIKISRPAANILMTRMVFERFLLPVSLAEGEAGKALGGPSEWRTENEREYYAGHFSGTDHGDDIHR